MKKLISLVLAMMMFALPCLAEAPDAGVIGGADGPTSLWINGEMITGDSLFRDAIAAGRKVSINVSVPEVSGIASGDPTVDAAMTDLFKALGLRVVMQGDEYDMGLSLSEKDVLTMGLAVNGDDLYIKSNLIGGTIVFSQPEIEPIISRLLDMMVMMEAMTEEEAADIKAQLPAMMAQLEAAIKQSAGSNLTMEDLLAMDYSAFEGVYMDILSDLEEVGEITVPGMCDPATHGVRLSMDNAEFVNVIRAFFKFIKDNPKMLEAVAREGAYPTVESRKADWEMNGKLYQDYGFYESEEAYIAAHPTCAEALDMVLAELDTVKMLDGEFVVTIYFNGENQIVYLTAVLPMFTAEEGLLEADENAEVKGTTEILNVVYTRQTVAQGVSHVCNIDVEGEGATIDVLAQEKAWTIRMGDMASQETMLTINVTEENGVIKGDFDTYEEGLAGNFSFFHVADEKQFKTDIVLNMFHGEEYLTGHPNEEPMSLSFAYVCDYARDGVDFGGKEILTVGVNEMTFVVDMDIQTSEPDESIMAGSVIRPAELDDAAFANWFVGAYNAMNSWMGNALMALPQSVLMLILSSANTGY